MENYRKFRARSKAQGLWLLVVHVDMNKAETLIEIDADAVIHLVADDRHVMWQKERLLNIGLAHLPVGECSTVVWPDADMLFVNENWVQETHDMIQSGAQVVQPFQYALRLSRGVDWLDPSSKRVSLSKDEGVRTPGFAFSVQRGADRNEETRKAVLDSQQKHGYTGFAWAASRAALEDMGGLFDVAIVGGGDALMAHAFANHVAGESWEPYYYARRLSDRWSPLAKIFHVWADRAAYATQGKLGWVSGTALHLWHGSKEGRQYGSRFDILHKGTSSFDPDVHLERSECAVVNSTVEVILEKCFLWQWRDGNSDAARMRRDVRRMFQLREEDG
ncbi:Hypothetical Protein FCC1311_006122 [Hondaea fermentalgiana]|uniref:Uncharacterized protein n=1 Tax=Hondaea fermentalgiana TaxID=2315210 RepID=A0A2R5G9Q9_9STRA|nr:Hypothetical Protein FCC1311_006122 [Hondaea fermentalgiana]|eukprot:GBG24394.1 Hypothetical Protein FCC1311_006122 [Hondaea fermentalgiana]